MASVVPSLAATVATLPAQLRGSAIHPLSFPVRLNSSPHKQERVKRVFGNSSASRFSTHFGFLSLLFSELQDSFRYCHVQNLPMGQM